MAAQKKVAEKFAQFKNTLYLCTRQTTREHKNLEIALWCNGSTSDSGSACGGSNPSKATQRTELSHFDSALFRYPPA